MDADSDELVRERHGAVAVLRLNRPDARNALTAEMIGAIGAAIAEAEADEATRAVVVTGTGDRAFCAGMDLRAFAAGGGPAVPEAEMSAYLRLLEGDVAVPVVGAANATAVAGGLELLLGCDVVVAADDARFGLPEVKRGLIAGRGVLHLASRVPLGIALELALTGDPIDAHRARELGLVNVVVARSDVLPTALDIATRIAANAPLAIAATKELVRRSVTDLAAARARLAEWEPRVFGSEDAKEGARAFAEQRPPRWTGR